MVENILCLDGEFDVYGNLQRAVTSQHYKDGLIVVAKSPGGGLRTTLDITRYLKHFDYSVVISGLCASACAQFLFIGARYKYVVGSGVVAIHGGPIPVKTIKRMTLTRLQKDGLIAENREFKQFYKDEKVDINLTRSAPKEVLDRISKGEVVFWVPKRGDLEKYGVKGVFLVNADIMTQ